VSSFVRLRIQQRCRFAFYCRVAEFVVADAETSTVKLGNLPSRTSNVPQPRLSLKLSIRGDVVNGLRHDVEQSEHLYVTEADWDSEFFLNYLHHLIDQLWHLLSSPKVTVDEWSSWRELDTWNPPVLNLQDLCSEVFESLEDQDMESGIASDDPSMEDQFQQNLQYLLSYHPQAQPTEPPQQPTSKMIQLRAEEQVPPPFDLAGLHGRTKQMVKNKLPEAKAKTNKSTPTGSKTGGTAAGEAIDKYFRQLAQLPRRGGTGARASAFSGMFLALNL